MKRTVYILSRNHFDNTWRRCWDRPYAYHGKSYVSYVTVEAAVLDEELRLAAGDKRWCFEVESSRLLRRYVEDHPGSLEAFRRLWDDGRFCLLGSGEVIPDANMPRGETLVRNLAEGIWWSEEALGRRPSVGWHADGFGSCAQLPQIFAGCGMRWIAALSYQVPSREYWRGLDGTVAYIGRLPNHYIVDYVKYPPCKRCAGTGAVGVAGVPPAVRADKMSATHAGKMPATRCDACGGYGIDFVRRLQPGTWYDGMGAEVGTLTFFGEEVLPPEGVPAALEQHASEVEYRIGTFERLLPAVAGALAACDAPPAEKVSPEPDGNPSTSGGLVTRIELKRRHRLSESLLTAVEAWQALQAQMGGTDKPEFSLSVSPEQPRTSKQRLSVPPEHLRGAWRDLCLCAFHDALPATHIDPAYAELMDFYDGIDAAATAALSAGHGQTCLYNPSAPGGGVREVRPAAAVPDGPIALRIEGADYPVIERTRSPEGAETLWADVPDLAPMAARAVEVVAVEPPPIQEPADDVIDWSGGSIRVRADGRGLLEVGFDGRPALRPNQWGIGEPIVEVDIGDPWATRDRHRPRRSTQQTARRQSVRLAADFLELTYTGHDPDAELLYSAPDPQVIRLRWTQRWRFYRGRPYADLRTEIDWSSYHRRVRLAFPTPMAAERMWTEVPFGVLARDRYEQWSTGWNNAGGDWPVIGWAAVEEDGRGLAVLNRGTPSYRCEKGTIFVSVLRSPAFPNCLEEPTSYSAPDYDGMRDAGMHVFEHRVVPYVGDWRSAGVVAAAEAFNVPLHLLPGRPSAGLGGLPEGVAVAAVKRPHKGDGLVVRLVEMHGQERSFRLSVPGGPWKNAHATNLLEDTQHELPLTDGSIEVGVKPWQIMTLLLRPQN